MLLPKHGKKGENAKMLGSSVHHILYMFFLSLTPAYHLLLLPVSSCLCSQTPTSLSFYSSPRKTLILFSKSIAKFSLQSSFTFYSIVLICMIFISKKMWGELMKKLLHQIIDIGHSWFSFFWTYLLPTEILIIVIIYHLSSQSFPPQLCVPLC